MDDGGPVQSGKGRWSGWHERPRHSGCAPPASARSGRCPCPNRVPTRCWSAHSRSGISRGTETLVYDGRVPESQYAAMRAPFQDGDFPGPVKYGYLSVGVVEQRAAPAPWPHRVLPAPAPDVVRRAGRRGHRWCPTACLPRGRCWPAPSRPPSTRSGTPRPCVGDRVAVVGAGMVGCCVARLLARHPRGRGDARRRRPRPARGRRGARRRLRPARATADTGAGDLVVHTSAHLRGAAALPRPAGRGGHRRRPQLVRRRRDSSVARWRRSTRAGCAPRQPGGRGRPARRDRRTTADRLRAGPRPAARPRVRRAAHRRVAASTSCPR